MNERAAIQQMGDAIKKRARQVALDPMVGAVEASEKRRRKVLQDHDAELCKLKSENAQLQNLIEHLKSRLRASDESKINEMRQTIHVQRDWMRAKEMVIRTLEQRIVEMDATITRQSEKIIELRSENFSFGNRILRARNI